MINSTGKIFHFWGNVRERLNLYGWRIRIFGDGHSGYCWIGSKVIDIGGPYYEQCLIHEVAHIFTCRFCNNKHTWDFWKLFNDFMYRFLPNREIAENEINQMKYGSEGKFHSLSYE